MINNISGESNTVRIVIKVQPETASKIRQIPAKKRSKFIEESILKRIQDEEKTYAFQRMFLMRDAMKGASTQAKIVRDLRKDRQSH